MNIKQSVLLILLVIFSSNQFAQNKFYIDLNNRADDLFNVTLIPENLSDENSVFQFAASAPGTYTRMDIGQYVKSFKAYDDKGNEIGVKQKSINQWTISKPEEVAKIVYQVEDTWDAQLDSGFLFRMTGSNIQDDNVVINGQCVFGYFHGMQSEPIYVKLNYPEDWQVGTALQMNNDSFYVAESYDYIVDSPIMLGKLTKESTTISNAEVNVYTFSETGMIKSADILSSVEDILNATNEFTEGLPVDHYTFLFHFEDQTHGAWEHSYSSFYVYKEDSLKYLVKSIREVVAHEFFHVVTPLNIHSELVEKFNFEEPVMSQHLWFYEGVTEWAANIIELRGGIISLEDYLNEISKKLSTNDHFRDDISLTYLGVNSTKLQDQYFNIYQKGAVVGALLDLRLLELSDGKMGLREVINELADKYGPDDPFDENTFFDEITDMTYPEIKDFFDDYVKGTKKLPVEEYFNYVGIDYTEKGDYDSSSIGLGVSIGFDGTDFIIAKVDKDSPNYSSIVPGDKLKEVNDEELNLKNVQKILAQVKRENKPGDKISVTVLRDDESVELELTLTANREKHIFTVNKNATEEQLRLRNSWMHNL